MKKKNFVFTLLLFLFFTLITQNTAIAQLSYAKSEEIIDNKLSDWLGTGWLSVMFTTNTYEKGSADVEDIFKTGQNEYIVKGTFKDSWGLKIFKARFRITGSGKVKILRLCRGKSESEPDWNCKNY